MKEYLIEDGPVDLQALKANYLLDEDYIKAHAALPICCHDVFVHYRGGILLVERKIHPAKGFLWCIGGRLLRGIPTETSLSRRVKGESNLDLIDIVELGTARLFFKTDPFGHGKGTDTPVWVYGAKGEGDINLDDDHKRSIIVTQNIYTSDFRSRLHPYIQYFMDKAMKRIN